MDIMSDKRVVGRNGQSATHRVLVVDDNNLNRDLLRIRLERERCEVLEAEHGAQALEMLQEQEFDLIILDVVMPVMDGMQTLKAIKSNDRLKGIPVIMVSAVGETETVAECLAEGADDFLTKPFNPVFLKVRMRACFEQKRLNDLENRQAQSGNALADYTSQPLAKDGQAALILTLAKLIESRGVDKGSRLVRIREYCRVLALHLQVQPAYQDSINSAFMAALHFAAPLHDIGKISIADAIINKPGILSDHERALMQQHTQVGTDALHAIQGQFDDQAGISMAIEIAESHHERWDGAGYPRGLEAEAIPLAARILALGDVYDALTSRRPHRLAIGHGEARAVLLEQRGKQFDPAVVDAFLATENDFMTIRVRYVDPRADREE